MNEMNIPFETVKPAFSYRILGVTTPTWTINPPEVNFEMKSVSKNCVDGAAVRQQFKQMLSEKYAKLECNYTDGSKGSRERPGVGSAAVWGNAVRMEALPPESSIYTAEVYAIVLALKMLKACKKNCVVFSDAYSVLVKLSVVQYTDTYVRMLQHEIVDRRKRNQKIEFCWVSSHVGIRGNEHADMAAKRTPTLVPTLYTDYCNMAASKLDEKWNTQWVAKRDKMKSIKPRIEPWKKTTVMGRTGSVKLNRLRIGHTLFTHRYLMNGTVQQGSPECPMCQHKVLTVSHFLTDCQQLRHVRTRFFKYPNPSIETLIGDGPYTAEWRHSFLKYVGMWDVI